LAAVGISGGFFGIAFIPAFHWLLYSGAAFLAVAVILAGVGHRKIRHRLTRFERRAFQLLYFRQPRFGYRLAVDDPVLMSFFHGMDQDTQHLILGLLVFKWSEKDGRTDLGAELERRWRAYLRFYPYWVEIIQEVDREAKRQQTMQHVTISLDSPIGTESTVRELLLKDTLEDTKSRPPDLLEAIVTGSGRQLTDWANRYCTPTMARHVIGRFSDRKTETQIAEEDGISQQAVSKSLTAALRRIREGLIQDGKIEVE
jgi:hypothetical protein